MDRWLKWIGAAFFICGAMVGCGGDDPSPVVTEPVTPVVAVPAVPTSLSVEPGDAVNTVQWSAVAGATSYTLYWTDVAPLTKQSAKVITGAVSPYTHTGLTNGKLLYYAVTARNSGGESDLSSVVGAMPVAPVPAAPTTLAATPGDGSVALAWAAVSGATSYNVYWSRAAGVTPGGAGATKIGNVTSTSYSHVGLVNGDRYYYVVTAVNSGGESKASSEVSAAPQAPAPGAPQNLAATAGDTDVLLSWSPTLNATSYNVYWSKATGVAPGGAGVTQIPGITATSYKHTGLTNGDTYYYVVRAVSAGVESASSAEKSARPLPPPPPAPLGITAIAPKDAVQVTVQWYDVVNYPSSTAPIQLKYNLYRGLQAGIATYYKDATKANKFADVTAPFVDATVATAADLLLRRDGLRAGPSGRRECAFGRGFGHDRQSRRRRRRWRRWAEAESRPGRLATTCPSRWCLPTLMASRVRRSAEPGRASDRSRRCRRSTTTPDCGRCRPRR